MERENFKTFFGKILLLRDVETEIAPSLMDKPRR